MDQSDVLLHNYTITIKTAIILALYVRFTFFANTSCWVFSYILLFRADIWNAIYFLNNSKNLYDFYLIMDQSDVLLHNYTITIKPAIILALYVRLTFLVHTSYRVFSYILLFRADIWNAIYFLNNSKNL